MWQKVSLLYSFDIYHLYIGIYYFSSLINSGLTGETNKTNNELFLFIKSSARSSHTGKFVLSISIIIIYRN